jgi:lipoate-protein ligase B
MPEPTATSVPIGPAAARRLVACHLGATPYAEGLEIQEALVHARAAGETGDWLLFPDHPPVITVGRGGDGSNIKADTPTLERLGVPVFEVARGGDVTWHGPGQLVGYPICDLSGHGKDLHRFLRGIERSLIRGLARFGIEAGVVPGRTGVWVGESKVASIGIAVRRWVSYHGFALNVAPDLDFFDLIHPCGLAGVRMTSMARCLGDGCPGLAEVREVMAGEVAAELGYKEWCWGEAPRPRTSGGPPGPRVARDSSAGVERAA